MNLQLEGADVAGSEFKQRQKLGVYACDGTQGDNQQEFNRECGRDSFLTTGKFE
jgi:hypothetical protein